MHTMERSFFLEVGAYQYTAEVSQLQHGKQLEGRKGLPRKFIVPRLGNGEPFEAVKIERREGDLMYIEYRQRFGCLTLTIFND